MSITYEPESRGSATILPFPRKRGRPRLEHRGHDSGTPELAMKRLRGETSETLDLCLERGLITPKQHWCGVHLRWLYTLRYGAPGIRALDPTHIGGVDIKLDDPQWRASREGEYNDALKTLMDCSQAVLVMNICIYNERPHFLTTPKTIGKNTAQNTDGLDRLRYGLDRLIKLWER